MNWQKVYNPVVKLILKTPLHGFLSNNIMLVRYTGHKSGAKYEVPVSYIRGEDGTLLVISRVGRVWWRSLRGGVDVALRLRGSWREANAEAHEDTVTVEDGLLTMLRANATFRSALQVTMDDEGQITPQATVQDYISDAVLVTATLNGEACHE